MPIRIDSTGGDTPSVKPGTNAHELLTVLLDHPEIGFSPTELTELTDVPYSSVHKTLSRLREKGLVRKVDSYWAVAEDVAGIGPPRDTESVIAASATFEDENPWIEHLPDV
ncbi:MarR family transcriptional regulator [Halopenitus persicus]|uniref:MarR family transcriptional regulator n=1 Tax=Halopenitus persicus TaxID=1048396 RepID=UPI0012FD18CD|nr:helix-turn-helix domain-containing protein [Halopenitus persicus]